MFHLSAYFQAIDATANIDVDALTDDILFIQNTHFVPGVDMRLMWAYAGAVTLTRARINSPKIRQTNPNYIRPINAALLPPTFPNIADYSRNPFILRAMEEIQVEATDSAAGPNNFYALLAMSPGPVVPSPAGDVYNLRFTGATTAVASAWTTIAATYETLLPAGMYDVVGGELQSTTGVAFRCIFGNQVWRPGGLAFATIGLRAQDRQYNGGWGRWGQFSTIDLPRIQVLCNAGDTAQEGYLQVVRRS